jgi:hypothetical protein
MSTAIEYKCIRYVNGGEGGAAKGTDRDHVISREEKWLYANFRKLGVRPLRHFGT